MFCIFARQDRLREPGSCISRITENTRVQFPVGTKVWRGHLVYVASGITSRRTKQRSGKRRATSLPTGNRAPSGAVIFSRMQDAPRVFLCYKNTYAREDYREYSASIPGRNQSSERASCLRRKRDYVAPHQATLWQKAGDQPTSVSYTHLTLPTICSV